MTHTQLARTATLAVVAAALAACASYDADNTATTRLPGEGPAAYRQESQPRQTHTTTSRIGTWEESTQVGRDRDAGLRWGQESRFGAQGARPADPYGRGTAWTDGRTDVAWDGAGAARAGDTGATFRSWGEQGVEGYGFDARQRLQADVNTQLDESARNSAQLRARTGFASEQERQEWNQRLDDLDRRNTELRGRAGFEGATEADWNTRRDEFHLDMRRYDADVQAAWRDHGARAQPLAPTVGRDVSIGVMGAQQFRFEDRDAHQRYVQARLQVLDDRLRDAARRGHSTQALASMRADLQRHQWGLEAAQDAQTWEMRGRLLDSELAGYEREFNRLLPDYRVEGRSRTEIDVRRDY
jgi:hypothetical protein